MREPCDSLTEGETLTGQRKDQLNIGRIVPIEGGSWWRHWVKPLGICSQLHAGQEG